jgi:hypothetical protein
MTLSKHVELTRKLKDVVMEAAVCGTYVRVLISLWLFLFPIFLFGWFIPVAPTWSIGHP